jgi:hypothetical protein
MNIIYHHLGLGDHIICNGLVRRLISKTIKLGSGYSDVSLGICAKELNIGLISHDGFKSQTPDFYKVEKTLIKDIYTFHYIKPDLMNEMYLILQQ